MSMHNYGVCGYGRMHLNADDGYGMFLNADEYGQFCNAYAVTKNIPDEDTVVEEFYDDKAFDAGFAVLDDDIFDWRSIRHLDGRQHEEDGDNFVDGFFLFSDRQGGILAKSTSCCIYPNIAAMADEFRKKFSTYLPEDFDYNPCGRKNPRFQP